MSSRIRGMLVAALLPLALSGAALAATGTASTSPASAVDARDLADAYAYLLGRAIVLRQEQTDLREPGVAYNTIKYNPAGKADFVNPNLDVAYLEAWIAVDADTPALLEIPRVEGRYYVAQILDEWGEVITNINERNYPNHPYGKFALVAPGSRAAIPADSVRIELHSNKAKMLGRVELKGDNAGAVALQRQFKLSSLGQPKVRASAPPLAFDNKSLAGMEIFDHADEIIDSALDVSPIAPQMQARARHYQQIARDPAQRAALAQVLRDQVVPAFLNFAVTGSGRYQNNWLATIGTGTYGSDYRKRTAANLVGLWANTNEEVVYFVVTKDADGQPLNGDNAYVLKFAPDERPEAMVNAYWSIILVDVPDYRVVPNPMNRFNFNSYSGLKSAPDGSLSLLFADAPNASLAPESNWLPAPKGKGFSLTLRMYVPKQAVLDGKWFPPALQRVGSATH
ncbi:DUF1214 domain-containing protein [Thermomonas mangrovi]|uniref:DUF1214 domain-containing protein n=1 Tax=Thermomonas mangrovi TaxID=2993316 RepID=UPI00230800D4|nr:DUF1214 domain-containing protein [Thermomonas mangrovi]